MFLPPPFSLLMLARAIAFFGHFLFSAFFLLFIQVLKLPQTHADLLGLLLNLPNVSLRFVGLFFGRNFGRRLDSGFQLFCLQILVERFHRHQGHFGCFLLGRVRVVIDHDRVILLINFWVIEDSPILFQKRPLLDSFRAVLLRIFRILILDYADDFITTMDVFGVCETHRLLHLLFPWSAARFLLLVLLDLLLNLPEGIFSSRQFLRNVLVGLNSFDVSWILPLAHTPSVSWQRLDEKAFQIRTSFERGNRIGVEGLFVLVCHGLVFQSDVWADHHQKQISIVAYALVLVVASPLRNRVLKGVFEKIFLLK